jgi:acyl dehydratase
MKIDPNLAGTLIREFQTEVRWRDTTNYAAAVFDENPAYFDDTREEGLVAHPVFPVAVTWPILENLDRFVQSDAFVKEILLTQVHYSERLLVNRLIRPGERLSISGEIAEIRPHRAGSHVVVRLGAQDDAGSPVFTEYTGALLRGVACDRENVVARPAPVPEPSNAGGPAWEAPVSISLLAPYLYDGCTDIVFPIHTSPAFAESVGLPGIILQGTATLAMAVSEIVNREADGDPFRVADVYTRFTGMVIPGTSIRVRCTGRESMADGRAVFFEVMDAQGKKALRDGYVKLL